MDDGDQRLIGVAIDVVTFINATLTRFGYASLTMP
jgi:hypothetical protein